MHGIHDMGGMDGFGPILIEKDDRSFTLSGSGESTRLRWACVRVPNVDDSATHRAHSARSTLIRPTTSDGSNATMTLLVERKRSPAKNSSREEPIRSHPRSQPNHFVAARRVRRRRARFREGDRVVARNLNPVGHTRLPRYVRGKRA